MNGMRPLSLCLALLFVLAGCSGGTDKPKGGAIQIASNQQVQEIPFQSGLGQAIVVMEGSAVDCLIVARGLNPSETYRIKLIGDDGASPGVMFGPQANVNVRAGTLEGEVDFKPNAAGELFVSMRNPIRMFEGAKSLSFQIHDKKDNAVVRSASFSLKKA